MKKQDKKNWVRKSFFVVLTHNLLFKKLTILPLCCICDFEMAVNFCLFLPWTGSGIFIIQSHDGLIWRRKGYVGCSGTKSLTLSFVYWMNRLNSSLYSHSKGFPILKAVPAHLSLPHGVHHISSPVLCYLGWIHLWLTDWLKRYPCASQNIQ